MQTLKHANKYLTEENRRLSTLLLVRDTEREALIMLTFKHLKRIEELEGELALSEEENNDLGQALYDC